MKSALASLAGFYGHIPFTGLVVGHSLFVSALFKRSHDDRFLLNYWISFLAAFGGGTLTALLIQDPLKAANVLFTNNKLAIWWTLCWWSINYFPKDIISKLHSALPIRIITRACVCILRSSLIFHRVSTAVVLFPGVLAAPLILGTLAGSAGKMLVDALQVSAGISKGPTEIALPGFTTWSAFLASMAAFVLVHATHLLSEQEALGLITTVLVAHGVSAELIGLPLDFTQPVAKLFHTVSLIPIPTQGDIIKTAANGKSKRRPGNPATPAPSTTNQLERTGHAGASHAAEPPGRMTRRRRAAVPGADTIKS